MRYASAANDVDVLLQTEARAAERESQAVTGGAIKAVQAQLGHRSEQSTHKRAVFRDILGLARGRRLDRDHPLSGSRARRRC